MIRAKWNQNQNGPDFGRKDYVAQILAETDKQMFLQTKTFAVSSSVCAAPSNLLSSHHVCDCTAFPVTNSFVQCTNFFGTEQHDFCNNVSQNGIDDHDSSGRVGGVRNGDWMRTHQKREVSFGHPCHLHGELRWRMAAESEATQQLELMCNNPTLWAQSCERTMF